MNYSTFYQLSRDFKRGSLQVTSKDIDNELPVVYGNIKAIQPFIFTYYRGNKAYDLIETGWVSLFLFSERIFAAFEERGVTGWKKHPTKVFDKNGELIEGYSVFAVTGRSGAIDDSRSELIWKNPPVPEGNYYQVRKGMYFDISDWDGSDIFIPTGSLAIIVTEKVKDILEQLSATNFSLRSVVEIESEVF